MNPEIRALNQTNILMIKKQKKENYKKVKKKKMNQKESFLYFYHIEKWKFNY